MTVGLSPHGARFVRRCLGQARFDSAEDVVEAALRAYESRTDSAPLRKEALLGLEQAAAGRYGIVTAEDLWWRVRRAC